MDPARDAVELEELVARAKRTDRTEARRRHRAELAGLTDAGADSQGAIPSMASSGTRSTPGGAPPQRPSITAAFKGAMRPLDVRGDLQALPQVLTSWGFLAAIGLTVVAAGWFVIAYNDAMAAVAVGAPVTELEKVVAGNGAPYFIATMAMQPPPAIGAFLIGFAAKRASWLGGLIYGIIVTVIAILVLQLPAGRLLTGNGPADAVIVGHAAWSPLGAALFASAAAWYRRFLDLSNPNRAAQRQRQGQPPKPRRGDMKPVRR